MAEPKYLWIPLIGKKWEDGTPRHEDRSANGGPQGDDTHDVAAAAASAFYGAFGMGDIPMAHLDDVDIELDQNPPVPGGTNGRILLRGLSHVDTGASDGKLHLWLFVRPEKGALKVEIQRLKTPRSPKGGSEWPTWRHFPWKKWQDDIKKGWTPVPIRNEFLQNWIGPRAEPGILSFGGFWELSQPWGHGVPGGELPWRRPRVASFPFIASSAAAQTRALVGAFRLAGLDVESNGACLSWRPRLLEDEFITWFQFEFGTGDSEHPFPWHISISLGDRALASSAETFRLIDPMLFEIHQVQKWHGVMTAATRPSSIETDGSRAEMGRLGDLAPLLPLRFGDGRDRLESEARSRAETSKRPLAREESAASPGEGRSWDGG